MAPDERESDDLLRRAEGGERAARDELFARNRERLKRFVCLRLDRRLAARVDPSDVVQETLAEAHRKMDDYLRGRPLPFYPWLRQIAWDKLVELHRRHVRAQRRSVTREEAIDLPLAEESGAELAERLAARGSSPSGRLVRAEAKQRVQAALERLSADDREVLVMRHLEQLKISEIAAVLGISEAAVQSRYRRAAERLHRLLSETRP